MDMKSPHWGGLKPQNLSYFLKLGDIGGGGVILIAEMAAEMAEKASARGNIIFSAPSSFLAKFK